MGARRPRAGASYPAATVPAGFLILLGDNTAESIDSRTIGPVPTDRVLGVALCHFGRRARQHTRWREPTVSSTGAGITGAGQVISPQITEAPGILPITPATVLPTGHSNGIGALAPELGHLPGRVQTSIADREGDIRLCLGDVLVQNR